YHHLHLAQHANVSARGRAFLVFGRPLPETSAEEYVCGEKEVAGAPLQQLESVVAAACVSAVTDPTMNEFLGMAAAFLQAGVGTYVGTLYPLSDIGSRRLVPELYRLRFESGLGWSLALRQAQLNMANTLATGAAPADGKVALDGRGPTMD